MHRTCLSHETRSIQIPFTNQNHTDPNSGIGPHRSASCQAKVLCKGPCGVKHGVLSASMEKIDIPLDNRNYRRYRSFGLSGNRPSPIRDSAIHKKKYHRYNRQSTAVLPSFSPTPPFEHPGVPLLRDLFLDQCLASSSGGNNEPLPF